MQNKLIISLVGLAVIIGLAGVFGIVQKRTQDANTKSEQKNTTQLPVLQSDSLPSKSKKSMKLTSTAFTHEGSIPSKYTCDGNNTNPPFEFSDFPKGTQSLAFIMDDPDVPVSIHPDGMWDHWLIWNIPVTVKKIDEGKAPKGVIGKNTGGGLAYYGPCPPDSEHRYFFRVYALDTNLVLDPNATTKQLLLNTMQGHVLAQAELMGKYKKISSQ